MISNVLEGKLVDAHMRLILITMKIAGMGSRIEYQWQRFWVRRAEPLQHYDADFLPDPDQPYARALNANVQAFDEVVKSPCAVLLGDAGSGKSMTLAQEHRRWANRLSASGESEALIDLADVGNRTEFLDKVVRDDRVQRWLTGAGLLHLSLDSLDEALLSYPVLPKTLIEQLHQLDRNRLRLIIACRGSEWPAYLQGELETLYGAEKVTVWGLAPLRRKDVTAAAEANEKSAREFWKKVWTHEATPLAAHPITLEMLIQISEASEPIRSACDLYERGCRSLIVERPNSTRGLIPRRLSVDQRMQIASRIACVMLFSARSEIAFTESPTTTSGQITARELAVVTDVTARHSRGRSYRFIDWIHGAPVGAQEFC